MSLSPQVDRTAGDKDESISTPPEHNYVVISKAPVASTADEPTTKMDEAKPDMMDESVTVAKDDSSASEALVAQADQAPTTGSDEVHRHDDVDMTEAHSAKPEDIEMTNSDPTDTTAPAGIDNTSSQTDAMDTSVPESPLEQSAQLPVKVELGTMPPSDAIEGMSLEKSDAAMDIDTQTVQQDAMDDVQTGGSPVIAPTSTVGTKGEDQDMRDAPQEKPALGSGRQVPSFGNTAPTGTPTTSQASTGFTFTPLKSTGISSLFAPAPSASPLFSSNGTSYTASAFLFAGASSSGFASQPAKSANFNIAKYRNTAKELVQVHPELHTDLKSILPEIIREQDTNKIDGRIRAYIRDATSAAELADNIQSALQMDKKDRFITETQYNTLKDYTVNAEKARKEAERQEVDMQGSGKQNGGKTTESVSKTMSFPGRSTGTSENFPTWSTKEEDAAKGPSMTDLLIKAKMNVLNKKDAVSAMFASMFDISLTSPSDTEIIINYLASHLLFGAALADDPLRFLSGQRSLRSISGKHSPSSRTLSTILNGRAQSSLFGSARKRFKLKTSSTTRRSPFTCPLSDDKGLSKPSSGAFRKPTCTSCRQSIQVGA
jgi:hypothetical protein